MYLGCLRPVFPIRSDFLMLLLLLVGNLLGVVSFLPLFPVPCSFPESSLYLTAFSHLLPLPSTLPPSKICPSCPGLSRPLHQFSLSPFSLSIPIMLISFLLPHLPPFPPCSPFPTFSPLSSFPFPPVIFLLPLYTYSHLPFLASLLVTSVFLPCLSLSL